MKNGGAVKVKEYNEVNRSGKHNPEYIGPAVGKKKGGKKGGKGKKKVPAK